MHFDLVKGGSEKAKFIIISIYLLVFSASNLNPFPQ